MWLGFEVRCNDVGFNRMAVDSSMATDIDDQAGYHLYVNGWEAVPFNVKKLLNYSHQQERLVYQLAYHCSRYDLAAWVMRSCRDEIVYPDAAGSRDFDDFHID